MPRSLCYVVAKILKLHQQNLKINLKIANYVSLYLIY